MAVGWPKGRLHSDETRYRMGAIRLGIDPSEYRAHREAGERWCSGCHVWEPVANFGPHARMRDGIDSQCRQSSRDRSREYQRQKRAGEMGRAWRP